MLSRLKPGLPYWRVFSACWLTARPALISCTHGSMTRLRAKGDDHGTVSLALRRRLQHVRRGCATQGPLVETAVLGEWKSSAGSVDVLLLLEPSLQRFANLFSRNIQIRMQVVTSFSCRCEMRSAGAPIRSIVCVCFRCSMRHLRYLLVYPGVPY